MRVNSHAGINQAILVWINPPARLRSPQRIRVQFVMSPDTPPLALDALEMALSKRQVCPGTLIHHADRDAQHACYRNEAFKVNVTDLGGA